MEKLKDLAEVLEESPFTLHWMFGHNPTLALLNLSRSNQEVEFLSLSGPIATIYNEKRNSQLHLQGHTDQICYTDTDRSNRFVCTADRKDSIVIWDRGKGLQQHPKPVRTIFEPFQGASIDALGMSVDARYLLAVSWNNRPVLRFWMWSFGKDECDGELNLPSRLGRIKKVRFNRNRSRSECFVLTMSGGIAFGEWDQRINRLRCHVPERGNRKDLVDSIYIEGSRKVISITIAGKGIIWSEVIVEPSHAPNSNRKEFVKAIQLTSVPLTAIDAADGIVLVGDESGLISLFDDNLKLLFHMKHLCNDPIDHLLCHPIARKWKIFNSREKFSRSTAQEEEEEEEIIFEQEIPQDYSAERKRILCRDFIIATRTGNVAVIDFLRQRCDYIFYRSDGAITTFDIHPKLNLISAASENGRLFVYNYHSLEVEQEALLPRSAESAAVICPTTVTYLLYSPSGEHLMCGLNNGTIYSLDPLKLQPLKDEPLQWTNDGVVQMRFSEDSKFLAYFDTANRVVLLHFTRHQWNLIGKGRYHYLPITELFFINSTYDTPRLVSVGRDLTLVEYDVVTSQSAEERLEMDSSVRFEQTAVPVSGILLPARVAEKFELACLGFDFALLLADNEKKLKIVDSLTGTILFTYLGPLFGGNVENLQIYPSENDDFLIFSADGKIGALLLPADGNPHRSTGVVANSSKITNLKVSHDGFIFASAQNEHSISMWALNKVQILDNFRSGGTGLQPFCCLFPGGRNGWLFQEMLDIFYYIQILARGARSLEERQLKDYIDHSEIVDFMRSIGFFPTDFQIRNIFKETSGLERTAITFDRLVKLYVNHRPVNATRKAELEKAIASLMEGDLQYNDEGVLIPPKTISRDTIIRIMTDAGERVDRKQAILCLKELWLCQSDDAAAATTDDSSAEEDLSRLPEQIVFDSFIQDLLGLDVPYDQIVSVAEGAAETEATAFEQTL